MGQRVITVLPVVGIDEVAQQQIEHLHDFAEGALVFVFLLLVIAFARIDIVELDDNAPCFDPRRLEIIQTLIAGSGLLRQRQIIQGFVVVDQHPLKLCTRVWPQARVSHQYRQLIPDTTGFEVFSDTLGTFQKLIAFGVLTFKVTHHAQLKVIQQAVVTGRRQGLLDFSGGLFVFALLCIDDGTVYSGTIGSAPGQKHQR